MTMKILHQTASRHLGHKDGSSGRPSQCPAGVDALAYRAGARPGSGVAALKTRPPPFNYPQFLPRPWRLILYRRVARARAI
jgi:hypothetical protein